MIHIGYHRTATTLVGLEVLGRTESVIVLGPRHLRWDGDGVCYANDSRGGGLDRLPAGRCLAIVDPSISGDAFTDLPARAQPLHRFAPEARILITIRSQASIVRGLYFQALKSGFAADFDAYFRLFLANRKADYLAMVESYRGAFGTSQVLVLPVEDLRSDAAAWVAALHDFVLGSDAPPLPTDLSVVKPTPSDRALGAHRLANRLRCPRSLRIALLALASAGDRLFGSSRRLTSGTFAAAQIEALDRVFGSDNRRLFDLLGSDIRRYPYPGSPVFATPPERPAVRP